MIEGIEDWDPDVVPAMELSEGDMQLMAQELVGFHQRFSGYYGRREHHRLGFAQLERVVHDAEAKDGRSDCVAAVGDEGGEVAARLHQHLWLER